MDIKMLTSKITINETETPMPVPTPNSESPDYYELDFNSLTTQRSSNMTITEEGTIQLTNSADSVTTSNGATVGVNLPAGIEPALKQGDSLILLMKGTVTGDKNFDSFRIGLANAGTSGWNSTTMSADSTGRYFSVPGSDFTILREVKYNVTSSAGEPTCIYFQSLSSGVIDIESMAIEIKRAS